MNKESSFTNTDNKLVNAIVLVVDDDPITTDFMVQALCPYYRTFSAHSGEDAIGFCAIHAPDLVILDLHMPVLDGLLTCKILKSIPSMSNCPVVFSTADPSTELEIKCWDAGATDFVSKPIVIQTLVKRIQAHIQAKIQNDLIANMVYIEPQTDLYNRQYFNESYDKQISLAHRNNDPLSLAIFELKQYTLLQELQTTPISTTHLRVFTRLISDELSRPTDTLFRYSDNEFAILFPDTFVFRAKHIIQNILSSVAKFKNKEENITFEKIDIAAGIASLEALQKDTNLVGHVKKNLLLNKNRVAG